MEVGKKKILNQFIGSNNSTQFVIPIYQRNYVWEKKNIDQLLTDIKKMIPYADDESENVFHFFGSIVYIDTLHKGSFSEWTIIDGQQRLTTIFILLQVLRQVYPESEKIISKKYLLNDEDIINSYDESDRYRLKPLVSDDDVYKLIAENRVDKIKPEDLNSNVYKAYSVIKKELLSWKSKYTIDQILGAIDKFKVVWIQLSKNEDPQQVFESINSTGVNLTPADLIRNYVLMNKDDKTQTNIYDNYWKPIEFEYVDTKNLKEFFRFYVSIKEQSTIPEREVYDRFKIKYEELLKEHDENEVLNDILNYAKNYKYLNVDSSELPNSSIIEPILKDFRNAKSNMPNIVLLETMDLYYNKHLISESDLINTIQIFTTYIVRRNIAGVDTKSISNMFGSLLGKILKYFSEGRNYYSAVLKALVADTRLTNQVMPSDKTIFDEFVKSNLYSREATAFVLKKIENNESRIPYSQLNIEHVMPQTDTEYWLNMINSNSEYEEVVNRIGNLTLVDSKDNSSMHNNDFDSKKEVLLKSKHIKMNEYILEKEKWNEDCISERSKLLAKEFVKIFPYPNIDTEKDDTYSHINIGEDSIGDYNYYKNSKPLEINIEDEIISNISTWTDALIQVIKKLYIDDPENFMEAIKILPTKYGYTTPVISLSADNMRSPIDIADNIYIETNSNTGSKLELMQRMIKLMSYEKSVNITYMIKE